MLGLCVQSSVMNDDYQSTTSECAKLTCNHPFDSIQRADSHSTHATSTISLGTGRCGVPSVCVDSYSFEPRADAESIIHDGHHLGVDAAAVVELQTSQSCSTIFRWSGMSQLKLNVGIFRPSRDPSLCASDGCGVTMYHFQVNL
jgi:hypothetical protein